MIEIAWYNLVAIIVGIIAVGLTFFLPKDDRGIFGALNVLTGWFIWFICVILFYTIWGGIFWW